MPQTIPAGGFYSCSITEFVGGDPGDVITNVVTASGVDDDGVPVDGSDFAVVTIENVPSSILTTKTANPTSVPETGGTVTFTVVVENTSLVDTVTINSVVDDQFGDVSASCLPALPVDLAPGETLTCEFDEFLAGDAGTSHIDVATASGVDDDGNEVSDDDDATVDFEDVPPAVDVTKTANPTSVPETGADVDFEIVVTNTSDEAVTITAFSDSDFNLEVGRASGRGRV